MKMDLSRRIEHFIATVDWLILSAAQPTWKVLDRDPTEEDAEKQSSRKQMTVERAKTLAPLLDGSKYDPMPVLRVISHLGGPFEIEDLKQVWGEQKAALLLTALRSKPPTNGKLRKQQRLKNAERDEWVERQRNKKPSVSWSDIYDQALELADKKQWEMPNDVKGLQEANRRLLARKRKAKKASAPR